MDLNYLDFIIYERSNFNKDVMFLSKYIYDNIDISKPKNIIILPENALGIKKCTVGKTQKNLAQLDIKLSTKQNIYINLNELRLSDIEHELNHALKFLKVGKERLIKDYTQFQSLLVTGKKINVDIFQQLVKFKYFTLKTEIDSHFYNIKEEFEQYLKNIKPNEENFRKNFYPILKIDIPTYRFMNHCLKFEPNKLKDINKEELQNILNTIEDNHNFIRNIDINNKKSIISKIKTIFSKKKNNHKLNIDEWIKKLEKEKKEALDYTRKKVSKLYYFLYSEYYR